MPNVSLIPYAGRPVARWPSVSGPCSGGRRPAALIILVIVSSSWDRFLTVPNLMNVLRQVAIVGILAIGMTFVILTKGIDLSVGSILGFSVVLFAGLLETQSMAVAIPFGLLAAMGLGLVNGIGVAYAGIPPFIMTLGMLSFARGLAFIYTGGTPIPILDESFLRLGNGYTFGVPIPSLILIGTLIAGGVVLTRRRSAAPSTPSARTRTPPDSPACRFGPTRRAFTPSRAGARDQRPCLRLAARVGTPIAGQAYELDAIAAVVVGGTALFGGKGSVVGTFIGTLIIGVLANILNLTGVDPFVQQLFKGALIVVAVFIMARSHRT